jgi:hypothetical protein
MPTPVESTSDEARVYVSNLLRSHLDEHERQVSIAQAEVQNAGRIVQPPLRQARLDMAMRKLAHHQGIVRLLSKLLDSVPPTVP